MANNLTNLLTEKYPPNAKSDSADMNNPAIRLYGRRFYKDQTPVEYLAEFLLVFASRKGQQKSNEFKFKLVIEGSSPLYWPKDHMGLKLFAFFPSSKLETRHPIHQKEYRSAINLIKDKITGSEEIKNEATRLLQSLFTGFVGVARNRTWVTHSFLPASPILLAREVSWKHTKAIRENNIESWEDALQYFEVDQHNFMGRGGEHLFLQLAHLFSKNSHSTINEMKKMDCYGHLVSKNLDDLSGSIEHELAKILNEAVGSINTVANFIEEALSDYNLYEEDKSCSLGWIPKSTIPEAFLLSVELENIIKSSLGALEKINMLQTLCCLHVLRSLCFQARRINENENDTHGFIGNYAWVISSTKSESTNATRKLAQKSFDSIEVMLYRALRLVDLDVKLKNFKQADKHGFEIFRKISKEIGLVIPKRGGGQRFVLTPHLLRFFVTSLLSPGERIRLHDFYERAFAHYGIAIGDKQIKEYIYWAGNDSGSKEYSACSDSSWVEEALTQGGFLVELSDAVSIVHNPASKE